MSSQAIHAVRKKRVLSDGVLNGIVFVIMLVISVITLYPFIYIIAYSFSAPAMVGGCLLLLPRGFHVDAYKFLFSSTTGGGIPHALLISFLRSTIGPFFGLLITGMGAYALSRRQLPGRKLLMTYVTVTMYFSSGMIPTYILMQRLHLTGSFWVYIIPNLFNVFNMILIKSYIEEMPNELVESALIDGATDFTIFFRILLPLCKPVLAAVLLFQCVTQWNLYYDTMLYNTGNKSLYTLQYILMTLVSNSSKTLEAARTQTGVSLNAAGLNMALTAVTTIPVLCVYPILQKYFAQGILIGSVKG